MPEISKVYHLPIMIIAEGPEDVGFFSAFIADRRLPTFHIEHTGMGRNDRGGHSKFGSKLRTLRLNKTFRQAVVRVLLVTDSDEDSSQAFNFVREQVQQAGFSAPESEGALGTGQPEICILTMPRGTPGNLETVLLDAAQIPDAALSCFCRQFVDNVATGEGWTDPKRAKLLLRSLLSAGWPRDPGINLAPLFRDNAACRRIPLEHQSLNWLEAFLNQFASIP